MKILRKTFAVVSVLAIVAGCVGCKKKPSGDTSSDGASGDGASPDGATTEPDATGGTE